MERLRIATRTSRLALWQAQAVAQRLRQRHPHIRVELLPMTTEGDTNLHTQLYKLGGKGLFLKELQAALHRGEADIAVHSAKDVPAQLPAGSNIVAVLERGNPHDVLVSNDYASIAALPAGAIVGTSSLRRSGLLRHYFPHVHIQTIRGNLDTRLAKLDSGNFHALVLAHAGLTRLGMAARICQQFDPAQLVPAIGQGIVAIETADNQPQLAALVAAINHRQSWRELCCERAFGNRLEADCHLPVAAHATTSDNGQISLHGLVAASDGSSLLQDHIHGDDPRQLGATLAQRLLDRGAATLLRATD